MRLRQQTVNSVRLLEVVWESCASSEDAGMLSLGRVGREQWRIFQGPQDASMQGVLGVWGARERLQTQPGSRTRHSRSCRCWVCLWTQQCQLLWGYFSVLCRQCPVVLMAKGQGAPGSLIHSLRQPGTARGPVSQFHWQPLQKSSLSSWHRCSIYPQ